MRSQVVSSAAVFSRAFHPRRQLRRRRQGTTGARGPGVELTETPEMTVRFATIHIPGDGRLGEGGPDPSDGGVGRNQATDLRLVPLERVASGASVGSRRDDARDFALKFASTARLSP